MVSVIITHIGHQTALLSERDLGPAGLLVIFLLVVVLMIVMDVRLGELLDVRLHDAVLHQGVLGLGGGEALGFRVDVLRVDDVVRGCLQDVVTAIKTLPPSTVLPSRRLEFFRSLLTFYFVQFFNTSCLFIFQFFISSLGAAFLP